jgi:3-keto-5-aminohexanoate cleavage enzyme
MRKVIITAAVTGSRPTKEMNPAVPYSPEEIAEAAVDCCRAGAAIAHIHVRDPESGRPAFRLELFKEVVDHIRNQCDIIINLTTSGFNLQGDNIIEQRLQPLSLKPELCSFDIGSLNFRDRAFINPPEWGRTGVKIMREQGVKPEIEVFDTGHIYQALEFIKEGGFEQPPYFQLCMGTKWGIDATPENLLFMKNMLPDSAVWSVLGIGKSQLSMIGMAIILGGNIRVGFEDNLYIKKGVPAKNNAQMVKMAVNLVHRFQKEEATPDEARNILGIKEKDDR